MANDCLKGLHNLAFLTLSCCDRLTSLPELPGSLKHLLASNCESLERLSGPLNTPNAQLNFTNCFKLDSEARFNNCLFTGGLSYLEEQYLQSSITGPEEIP